MTDRCENSHHHCIEGEPCSAGFNHGPCDDCKSTDNGVLGKNQHPLPVPPVLTGQVLMRDPVGDGSE